MKELDDTPADPLALTRTELSDIYAEIDEQPEWRVIADKEMDYADGNQLDSDLLRKQRELGIPPAIEDLIGPALRSIQGYEAASRTDWRVTPDGAVGGQDIADAISYRLNQAERHAGADRACSEAFRSQVACGIGWVEVARQSDPFKFPYRCTAVHRNEIHWDMRATEPDLSDARWLRRERWMQPERAALAFPDHREEIEQIGRGGSTWWADGLMRDGGQSTGLQNAWGRGRAWTLQEHRWYDRTAQEVCISEVWYRRWVSVQVLKMRDGRAVEYDQDNPAHDIAIATGLADVSIATVARVRRAYWIGPLMLHDGPTPYSHRHFPYVTFWGFLEDNTGIPYGYVRAMKYPQDSLNSGVSKLRWGMSVVRVERTKGAVAMTDAQLRKQVARADADIVLDAQHMAQPGARFDVKRDYQLSDQHHQMLADNRASIERTSAISSGFQGKQGTATSGLQEGIQVEQSNQSLGAMMDGFRAARTQVGEILMSMVIADIGDRQEEIIIEGDAVTEDRRVVINRPEIDEDGFTYLSNDLLRTQLQVGLEDVPSTHTYRGQQLEAMSGAVETLPDKYKAAAVPFLASLMDVPFKRDLVEALRSAGQQEDPEAVEKRVRADVANELKARELDMREAKNQAEIEALMAKAVQTGVQAAFAAMQAGAQVAQMPAIAPVADVIMQSAGYQAPTPPGDDPNYPAPMAPAVQGQAMAAPPVQQNTSPQFPPVAPDGESAMGGVETSMVSDNV